MYVARANALRWWICCIPLIPTPPNLLVVMNIDKKRIEEGPDYSEEHVLDRDYETRLHAHYQYPPYWI